MNVDFLHNQIIRDTITGGFIDSFNDNLVPYLVSQYGSMLDEVQFYEDHLTAGLRIGGEFFYPLTVVVNGKPIVRAVKWQVSNYRNYDKFNPFTYKGKESLEFELLDNIPDEVARAIDGKTIYTASGESVEVVLSSASDDKTFLSGKYSQGFVDLFARKMTGVIEREFDIAGLSTSGVVIEFRFEPGTFMEHIVKNTTYRRVLIKARGCAARDLWVKWTRLDGKGTYTISDNVSEDEIEFDIAEDVPGKIREKEYRYLSADSAEKYQNAMSRKNITEWREMMRRVIRRGEVAKLDSVVEESAAPIEEIESAIVSDVEKVEAIPSAFDSLAAYFDDEPVETADVVEEGADEDDDLASLLKSALGLTAAMSKTEEASVAVADTPIVDDTDDEEPVYEEDAIEEQVKEEDEDAAVELEPATVPDAQTSEEKIRYEIEKKLRAEMEAEMRRKEEEAEMLRARLEEKLRAEAREKELLAEAAKAALAEQERLERERIAAEERAREEEARREEERLARLRAEEEARIKAELEAKAKAEEEARAKEEARIKAEEAKYVSKTVKLFFKQQIDQSITKRIHEIILATIKYYHKEDVYIKVKANIPDITTVNLQFVKIPEDEIPLLVNIIKVLGRSDLGITRAILD